MKKCFKDHSLSDPGIFNDTYLLPHSEVISSRISAAKRLEEALTGDDCKSVYDFADYHLFFGFHSEKDSWVIREWAPNATQIYLICEKNGWRKDKAFLLEKMDNGIFEKRFPKPMFSHEDLFRLKVLWDGGEGDRIPTAATRVVQDSATKIFNAQLWDPQIQYKWTDNDEAPLINDLFIYEAHIGMAIEDGRVGTYHEFEKHILPQIIEAGYNTIQLMAIQEHPYYGSFGYQVSNFFSPSSRFGTPCELKSLIDTAHKSGMRVLIDIIHSHAVNNEVEGLSKFDGTYFQFFHDGPKGHHRQWDSRCFDYGKLQVLKFLLSNLRYWIEEFKIDGFRFDGVTSMLFKDNGLGKAFTCYDDYYSDNVDIDALSYLYIANKLVHSIKEDFISIAEDVSGYPGLAAPELKGGTGFDYRFSMGVPDYWIKLLKEYKDEDWNLGSLWYELTTKRDEEKTISYTESHDQALVGDKTIMMRLMDAEIYTSMEKKDQNIKTLRGVALHKMIRLITLATAGSGYLNFMGNEFGHPEWVDFPSDLNNWSFHYARRQWSLKHNSNLYYSSLFVFDREMISMALNFKILSSPYINLICLHEDDKIIAFERNNMVFIFNFHPVESFADYMIEASPGKYVMIMNTDENKFGGHNRLNDDQIHFTLIDSGNDYNKNVLSLYIPSRSGIVLSKVD